jgi:outer membrane immunogenic protein
MSRLLWVGAALIALVSGTAKAADLPIGVPVYTPAVVVPFTWGGIYLGIELGGQWGNDRITTTTTSAPGATSPAFAPAFDSASSGTLSSVGVTGGLSAGYNWQLGSNLLVGLEGDVNASTLNGDRKLRPIPGLAAGDIMTDTAKQPGFLFTVRPRVGWTFDHHLIYATAGYAFATYQVVDTYAFSTPTGIDTRQGDFTAKLSGWTAGAGYEYAFSRGVSAKIEYLYVGLNRFDTTIVGPANAFQLANIVVHHNYADNIVRVGLNFHPTW